MWVITVDFQDGRERVETEIPTPLLGNAVDAALLRLGLRKEALGGFQITAVSK